VDDTPRTISDVFAFPDVDDWKEMVVVR
jgi:hypothetical protein